VVRYRCGVKKEMNTSRYIKRFTEKSSGPAKRKIVISTYLSFNLSHKARLRYAELKGIKLYAWVDNSCFKEDENVPTVEEDLQSHPNNRWGHIKYSVVPKEECQRTQEEYFWDWDIPRDDPALIQIVEEMGQDAWIEKPNPAQPDRISQGLKIVEIPHDVEWHIEESEEGGGEWIAENYRTWGIEDEQSD
jgi:hypothetical protein